MYVQRKAVYYPNITLTEKETRFGLKKLRTPKNPYDSPLPRKDKFIAKVDLLEPFKDVWGELILLSRDNVWEMVSGDTTEERWQGLLCTYYKTHAAFSNNITLLDMFGDRSKLLEEKFVDEVKERLADYRVELEKTFGHCKFLLEDRGYIYYAVNTGFDLSDVRGVTVIC